MSASSFTDWEVRCDFPECQAQQWASFLEGPLTAAYVRKRLKRWGWLVDVGAYRVKPEAIGEYAIAKPRLDYCPDHKDRALKGKEDANGAEQGAVGPGGQAGGTAPAARGGAA